MNGSFEVSVVIPVYNAAAFVIQAVESALAQPEVREVILVEDCSPDDSLAVCRQLAEAHPEVKLFQHSGGVNRGAGPSRNLGITSSTCPYIAFLDADDFYLPGRFAVARAVFSQNSDCDGVYDMVGMYFDDLSGEKRWLESNMALLRETTVEGKVPAEDLFEVLMKGGRGHIHLNGLVIRRTVLEKSGLMDESIADTLHEDTDFVLRLATVGRLLPGSNSEPTSMRRVHAQNRVSAPRSTESILRDQLRLRYATYQWVKKHGSSLQRKLAFRRLLLDWMQPMNKLKHEKRSLSRLARFFWLPFSYPSALLEGEYYKKTGRAFWAVILHDLLRLKNSQ